MPAPPERLTEAAAPRSGERRPAGLELPVELRPLLDLLGHRWPEADEDGLIEMGRAWVALAGRLRTLVAETGSAATAAWNEHRDQELALLQVLTACGDPNAFENPSALQALIGCQDLWSRADTPTDILTEAIDAALLTGTSLLVYGAIVLALKVAVLAQLVVSAVGIAHAVAAAPATSGASLAEIPEFQQVTRTILGNLFQEVIWILLDG